MKAAALKRAEEADASLSKQLGKIFDVYQEFLSRARAQKGQHEWNERNQHLHAKGREYAKALSEARLLLAPFQEELTWWRKWKS